MNFGQPRAPFHELTNLPNISIMLEQALTRVGLSTPKALQLAGAEGAWSRLVREDEPVSIQTLLALEGAIQGVHWTELTAQRRLELKRFARRKLIQEYG